MSEEHSLGIPCQRSQRLQLTLDKPARSSITCSGSTKRWRNFQDTPVKKHALRLPVHCSRASPLNCTNRSVCNRRTGHGNPILVCERKGFGIQANFLWVPSKQRGQFRVAAVWWRQSVFLQFRDVVRPTTQL